jgi:GTP cyclohydrolase IA
MTQLKNNFDLDKAVKAYSEFMQAIGLDLDEPNSLDTPTRVAKMYRDDVFKGLYEDEPKITAFPNLDGYDGIVFQGHIPVKSICAHHHCPFVGEAFVAYLPAKEGKIIGLSKLNRIVEHYARRPQVQENLTMQIVDHINKVIGDNQGVAVLIQAKHTCVALRGIKHDSEMKTAKLTGAFSHDEKSRHEFYSFINQS